MNGFSIFINLFLGIFSLVFSSQAFAVEHDAKHTVLLLKSKESSYYNKTIHVIKNNLSHRYLFNVKGLQKANPKKNADLIITFGASAAKYARKHFPNQAKVLTFINLDQSLKLKLKNNEAHLLIELLSNDYLTFAKLILPNKDIGALYQKPFVPALKTINKQVSFVEVSRFNSVISATREIIKTTDVLLALPNKKIFNRHTLKGILLSTYQSRTPLVSYSPAHVKAGAVAAIYASPTNLGEHINEAITHYFDSEKINSQRQFAKFFSIGINHRVAQSLNLSFDSPQVISNNIKKLIRHE